MKNLFDMAGATIKTIMIVEEQTKRLNEIKSLLEKEDFTVVTTRNSREALECLTKRSEESFDLILVNTRMPGSMQTSALFCIKPPLKKQSCGIEQFLQKPFTNQELLVFVKEKIRHQ